MILGVNYSFHKPQSIAINKFHQIDRHGTVACGVDPSFDIFAIFFLVFSSLREPAGVTSLYRWVWLYLSIQISTVARFSNVSKSFDNLYMKLSMALKLSIRLKTFQYTDMDIKPYLARNQRHIDANVKDWKNEKLFKKHW